MFLVGGKNKDSSSLVKSCKTIVQVVYPPTTVLWVGGGMVAGAKSKDTQRKRVSECSPDDLDAADV